MENAQRKNGCLSIQLPPLHNKQTLSRKIKPLATLYPTYPNNPIQTDIIEIAACRRQSTQPSAITYSGASRRKQKKIKKAKTSIFSLGGITQPAFCFFRDFTHTPSYIKKTHTQCHTLTTEPKGQISLETKYCDLSGCVSSSASSIIAKLHIR